MQHDEKLKRELQLFERMVEVPPLILAIGIEVGSLDVRGIGSVDTISETRLYKNKIKHKSDCKINVSPIVE